jgi:hypothetical protein
MTHRFPGRDVDTHLSVQPRERAMRAMLAMLGHDEADRIYGGLHVPNAYRVVGKPLIVTAGDHVQPLDFTTLRPLALRHGCDVLATFVDPFRSGHRLLFDIVLHRPAATVHLAEYQLWLRNGSWPIFYPLREGGAVIGAVGRRLVRFAKPTPISRQKRLVGITLGTAFMHDCVLGGTPFEHPLDQWVGR